MSKRSLTIFLIVAAVIVLGAVVLLTGNVNNVSAEPFLEKYGLQGLTTQEVVAKLDGVTSEPAELRSSITGTELILSDASATVKLALPEDLFYLSFAPYISTTHPCGTHSLASCRGELVGKQVHVNIIDESGKIIADADMTTQQNGFVGIWLPRDINATLTVTYEGKTAQAPIATFATSDTCLTTPLKLS